MNLYDKIFIHHGNSKLIEDISYYNEELNSARWEMSKNDSIWQSAHNKNIVGLWASEYTPKGKYKSQWEEFARESDIRDKENLDIYFTFKLKENANILVIDTLENLSALDEKYVYIKTNDKKLEISDKLMHMDVKDPEYSNLLKSFFEEQDIILLNIANISKDYDGIFMTDYAISRMRYAFDLWSVESLVVFNTGHIETC